MVLLQSIDKCKLTGNLKIIYLCEDNVNSTNLK
jgi:hypothetical protein